MLDDFKFSVAHGGFGVLSVHSQQFEAACLSVRHTQSLMAQVRNYSKASVVYQRKRDCAVVAGQKNSLECAPVGDACVEVDITVLGDVPYEPRVRDCDLA